LVHLGVSVVVLDKQLSATLIGIIFCQRYAAQPLRESLFFCEPGSIVDGIRVDPLPLGHSLRVGADDRVLAACDEIQEMFIC
jgi:hypothetical protein